VTSEPVLYLPLAITLTLAAVLGLMEMAAPRSLRGSLAARVTRWIAVALSAVCGGLMAGCAATRDGEWRGFYTVLGLLFAWGLWSVTAIISSVASVPPQGKVAIVATWVTRILLGLLWVGCFFVALDFLFSAVNKNRPVSFRLADLLHSL